MATVIKLGAESTAARKYYPDEPQCCDCQQSGAKGKRTVDATMEPGTISTFLAAAIRRDRKGILWQRISVPAGTQGEYQYKDCPGLLLTRTDAHSVCLLF